MFDDFLSVTRAEFYKLTLGDFLKSITDEFRKSVTIDDWQYHFLFWDYDFLWRNGDEAFLERIGMENRLYSRCKILADMRAMPLPLCGKWKAGKATLFFPSFFHLPHRRRWKKAQAWLESRGYVFPPRKEMRWLFAAYWQYRNELEDPKGLVPIKIYKTKSGK